MGFSKEKTLILVLIAFFIIEMGLLGTKNMDGGQIKNENENVDPIFIINSKKDLRVKIPLFCKDINSTESNLVFYRKEFGICDDVMFFIEIQNDNTTESKTILLNTQPFLMVVNGGPQEKNRGEYFKINETIVANKNKTSMNFIYFRNMKTKSYFKYNDIIGATKGPLDPKSPVPFGFVVNPKSSALEKIVLKREHINKYVNKNGEWEMVIVQGYRDLANDNKSKFYSNSNDYQRPFNLSVIPISHWNPKNSISIDRFDRCIVHKIEFKINEGNIEFCPIKK